MEFKDIVKRRREELGLTMEEVANAASVSKATIHRYESGGIKNVRKDKISVLAKVLQITPEELMGWEEPAAKDQGKLSIKKAAELMNVGPQFIRVGLQRGILPIGTAFKISKNRYTYYISPKLFEDYTGIKIN